jgi:hypothetical protein
MLRSGSFALLAAVAAGLVLSGTALGGKPHPHIHRALFELREARTELKEAAHNFGGHRKAALRDVDAAIAQLEKAMEFSGDKRPFKGNPKAEIYKKYANVPHIRHALVELRATVTEMEESSHNYGGHKKKALEATRAAINQLKLCVDFASKK